MYKIVQMSKSLLSSDLDQSVRDKVRTQAYEKSQTINDIKIIDLKINIEEDGNFSELIRFTNGFVDGIPGYKIAQLNRTQVNPNVVKAWHFHLKQDMLWYVSFSQSLFVGLWDIRKKSSTCGVMDRVVLGAGGSQLLFIPRGIAHGSANFSQAPTDLYYFTNQKFNISNRDEKRLPWDIKGKEFWSPQRD